MMKSRIHARNMTRAGTSVLTRPDSDTAGAVVLEPTFWSLLGFALGACDIQSVCLQASHGVPVSTCRLAIAKILRASIVNEAGAHFSVEVADGQRLCITALPRKEEQIRRREVRCGQTR